MVEWLKRVNWKLFCPVAEPLYNLQVCYAGVLASPSSTFFPNKKLVTGISIKDDETFFLLTSGEVELVSCQCF